MTAAIVESSPALVDMASSLLEHLSSEASALGEVEDCLGTMHEAMRGSDLESLRAAEARLESLAGQLERLRRTRLNLVAALATGAGADPDSFTVRELVGRLPSPLAERLDAGRDALSRLAQRVETRNRANAVLALQGLAFIDDCLAGLYGELQPALYGRAGRVPQSRTGAILEARG